MLAALIIAGLAMLIRGLYRRRRRRAYRRAALDQLNAAWQEYERSDSDPGRTTVYLQHYSDILKRTALVAYRRDRVAGLTGEAWLEFLDRSGADTVFCSSLGRQLIDAPYRAAADTEGENIDVKALHEMGLKWINNHAAIPASQTSPGREETSHAAT